MTNWDRVGTSVALDKKAALVTGRGVHWESDFKRPDFVAWQDTPLPTLPLPGMKGDIPVGYKVGRLTVVGYGGSNGRYGRWVVRCTCGAYGHRKAKSLKPDKAPRAMCDQCDYLDQLKLGNKP